VGAREMVRGKGRIREEIEAIEIRSSRRWIASAALKHSDDSRLLSPGLNYIYVA